MRYARDIRELETRVDSSVVYDRHYIMIAQDNSRMWQTIYESARDTAAGESVYLEWAGWGGADEYTAADCMQIAIASRVDGIILYTDGDSRISGLIDEAMEQGIPVVTVMNDDTESRRVSYVGVNHYQLGNICGEQVLELLKDGGEPDHDDFRLRRRGRGHQPDVLPDESGDRPGGKRRIRR